ncbi:MAG: protein kinase [Deltaproteobacteria bacterium]|nr:protein kinase [Deltaproteobacteria bacterium]
MTRNKHSGKVLDGRYEILSLLDEGGMGAVYLGRHVKLGRSVAVKILHGELKGNKDVVARFYREAQAASGISHPNIIDVYDVGVADWGEPYLVMEYLSGENLASLLKRKGPISLAAACGIMEPVLRALHAAHERGIVHRDLKPDNIFLMRQEDAPPIIKVIDFGISKFLQTEQTKLTRTGALLGTPSYMSPEQARGRGAFDHRADIYAMGVVLYSMLCGSLPFVGESYNDLIVNILTEPVKNPIEAYPDFPAEAEPIVMRLLEKDPERRFATCLELLEALASLEAFADRQTALIDLTADMPESFFATGDLGDTDEFLEEIAATVYAEMGENEAETVLDKPLEALEEVVGLFAEAKPSEDARSNRQGSRWRVPLFIVGLVVVGIWIGLYVTGVMSTPLPQSTDPVDITGDGLSGLSSTQSSLGEDGNTTDSPDGSVSQKNDDGSGFAPSITDAHLHATDDQLEGIDSESGIVTEDATGDSAQIESAQNESPGDDTPLAPVGDDAPADAGPAKSEPDSKVSAPGISLTSNISSPAADMPETQRAGAVANSVAPLDEPVTVRPTDVDAALSPLTPTEVNRLVETRHKKVMTCYDIARAKTPGLEGILELKVGMAGSTVEVTVTGGNISGFLSTCVTQVIRSITVPPNDGTLVEILKEYEFR